MKPLSQLRETPIELKVAQAHPTVPLEKAFNLPQNAAWIGRVHATTHMDIRA